MNYGFWHPLIDIYGFVGLLLTAGVILHILREAVRSFRFAVWDYKGYRCFYEKRMPLRQFMWGWFDEFFDVYTMKTKPWGSHNMKRELAEEEIYGEA